MPEPIMQNIAVDTSDKDKMRASLVSQLGAILPANSFGVYVRCENGSGDLMVKNAPKKILYHTTITLTAEGKAALASPDTAARLQEMGFQVSRDSIGYKAVRVNLN